MFKKVLKFIDRNFLFNVLAITKSYIILINNN